MTRRTSSITAVAGVRALRGGLPLGAQLPARGPVGGLLIAGQRGQEAETDVADLGKRHAPGPERLLDC